MLAKKNRIPRKLFNEMLKKPASIRNGSPTRGGYFNTPHFSLRVAHSTDNVRAAVSVSKKVSKKAVDRNKLRRRVYAIISPRIKDLKTKFYFFSARTGAEKLKIEQLKEEIKSLLSKSQ